MTKNEDEADPACPRPNHKAEYGHKYTHKHTHEHTKTNSNMHTNT